MSNPWADPRARAWKQRVERELIPMMEQSGACVSIVPGEDADLDVQMCVELGAMILLDKPIILAVPPGRAVPTKLRLIADEIVPLDMDDPASRLAIGDAIARVSGATDE